MRLGMVIRTAIILVFSNQVMASDLAPSIDKYPAEAGLHQSASHLNMNSKFAKRFKTLLSQELKQGPDFAGKYRIVRIGCGSGCVGIGIIDCETGEAFDSKMTIDQSSEALFKLGDNIEFRKDSRLLILRGCINEDRNRCGVSQFDWNGREFLKISFDPLHSTANPSK